MKTMNNNNNTFDGATEELYSEWARHKLDQLNLLIQKFNGDVLLREDWFTGTDDKSDVPDAWVYRFIHKLEKWVTIAVRSNSDHDFALVNRTWTWRKCIRPVDVYNRVEKGLLVQITNTKIDGEWIFECTRHVKEQKEAQKVPAVTQEKEVENDDEDDDSGSSRSDDEDDSSSSSSSDDDKECVFPFQVVGLGMGFNAPPITRETARLIKRDLPVRSPFGAYWKEQAQILDTLRTYNDGKKNAGFTLENCAIQLRLKGEGDKESLSADIKAVMVACFTMMRLVPPELVDANDKDEKEESNADSMEDVD